MTTIMPAWLARTKKNVHLASVAALPSPWPFQSKRGRILKPVCRRYGIIASDCTTRPRSVPTPRSRTPSAGMVVSSIAEESEVP